MTINRIITNDLKVGDGITMAQKEWSFGGDIPQHFDNHVTRSIPFYNECHKLVCDFSDFFIHPKARCYDLGCSTGRLITKLASQHHSTVEWIGLDYEADMIDKAKEHHRTHTPNLHNIKYETADIKNYNFQECELVVSLFTLQFIPLADRPDIIKRIYQTLRPGGAFIFFEKILGSQSHTQDMINQLYLDYKRERGYSDEEIMTKLRGLKKVLKPQTSEENLHMLKEAGFSKQSRIFQYLCFEGILCMK